MTKYINLTYSKHQSGKSEEIITKEVEITSEQWNCLIVNDRHYNSFGIFKGVAPFVVLQDCWNTGRAYFTVSAGELEKHGLYYPQYLCAM